VQVESLESDKKAVEVKVGETNKAKADAAAKHADNIRTLWEKLLVKDNQIALVQAEVRHREAEASLVKSAFEDKVKDLEQKLAMQKRHNDSLAFLLAEEKTRNGSLAQDNREMRYQVTTRFNQLEPQPQTSAP